MNAREWIAAYARELGVEPPTAGEFSTLLELAAVAAHSSERVAAPVACWLAAGAGLDPAQALAAAGRVGGGDDGGGDDAPAPADTRLDPDTGLDREPPRP